jgi:hypothetical protein
MIGVTYHIDHVHLAALTGEHAGKAKTEKFGARDKNTIAGMKNNLASSSVLRS